jgi:3-phosphoshikimate 1-carboxyvinyltransferase
LNALLDPGRAASEPALPGAVTVGRAARLRGTLRVPGDKSVSHRALLLAALAAGTSRIAGAGDGDDVRTTARLIAALGASVDREPAVDGSVVYTITSPGIEELVEPDDVLDCGNSGTSLRLLAGILAGQRWATVLTGDASLRRRPMGRIVRPLVRMGATVRARAGDDLPPLAIAGHAPLRAIDHETEVPSAQVKSAVLLAGLRADGATSVTEIVGTRDHTERMLRARGVAVRTEATPGRGTVGGGHSPAAIDEHVPGDVSAAAFWLVAAAIHPDAELQIEGVGLNPTRTGVVTLLRRMGADMTVEPDLGTTGGETAGRDSGEPMGRLLVRSSALRAIDVSAAEVAGAIDEVPILCLAATQAAGTTTIRGVAELRVKESDRVAGIADGLAALGARIDIDGNDLRITGPTTLRGGVTDARLDHRLAMTFAIGGLVADGDDTSILGASSASISYPGFFDDLERVQA